MSNRGGFRGSRGGTGGTRGGFGGSRGNFRGSRGSGNAGGYQQSFGPPDTVQELGTVMHACEGEIVCQSSNPKIPFFNAPIYLENKTVVGKVDEILGPMNEVYFTVKPQDGVVATSFKQGDVFFIGPDKLLPLDRFLPKPKALGPKPPKSARRGARGGRGAPKGGRTPRGGRGGMSRGAPRGGGSGRGGGRAVFSPRGGRGGFTPRSSGGFRGRG